MSESWRCEPHAEKEAFALLALQQPVAGELREIFSAIQIIADTERMGALAVHVAKIVRREYPKQCFPRKSVGASLRWPRWQSPWGTAQNRCCFPATRRKLLNFTNKTTPWMSCIGICLVC